MSFFDSIRQSANEMAAEAQKLVTAQRMQLNLTNLRRERDQSIKRLGEKTYQRVQDGAIQDTELSGLIREVADLDTRIIALEEEIRRVRVQGGEPAEPQTNTSGGGPEPQARFCPNCGMRAKDDAVFCISCGSRL